MSAMDPTADTERDYKAERLRAQKSEEYRILKKAAKAFRKSGAIELILHNRHEGARIECSIRCRTRDEWDYEEEDVIMRAMASSYLGAIRKCLKKFQLAIRGAHTALGAES